ncbi:MAG: O-antigen ligase family protein, partial [Parcubacteria group bacterium]|nr:O-antigen ligase family protein [Parcubacteria group bacterium]
MVIVDRALLWLTRGGVFLVPFIPLVVSGSMFFPFITGKNFAFRIIVEIVFAAWLLLALWNPRFRPKKSMFLWSVLAFFGVILLADIFAENPFKAFWSNFERMEGFITLLHLGAYFLVAGSVLSEEKWWMRFFATSVGVSAFLGIYGILQLAGKIVINQGGARLDGTFGNAAYFAGYMLFHIFLTLFLLFRHKVSLVGKYLYGGALLLQIFTLIFTATRGAGIGLVIGLLLTFLLVAVCEKSNRKLRIGALCSFVALVVLVGGLYAARENSFIKQNQALTRFASISKSDAGPRFMVWGMAWQGFKENPILGWGQEGFNYAFNKYYNPNMWGQEQWFDRTHNILFDWLIAGGLLGLLAYLSLYGFLLLYIWRGTLSTGALPFSLAEKSVLTGLLAGYFIHNLFVFDNIGSYILFFSLLAFFGSRTGIAIPRLDGLPVLRTGQPQYIVGACVLIALAAVVYFFNIRGIVVSRALIEGLKAHPQGATENLAAYARAFARDTIGSQETAEQLMQSAITVANAPNAPAELKAEFIAFGEEVMGRELQRAPRDARLQVFLGMFYNRLSRSAEAVPYLEKAHALSPNKQTIAFELASTYLNIGKTAEALELLRKAYESAPKFPEARKTYAVAAIYAKQFELAAELLNPIVDIAVSDERVVKAYYDVKQYDKVLDIWKARAERNPTDPQAQVSLAAAYLLNGERQRSVAALQKASELNPSFKE